MLIRYLTCILVATLLLGCGDGGSGGSAAPSSEPGIPRVVVIAMENREYESVIGNPAWPNVNNLANSYTLATNYFAVTHPSLPNFVAMASGITVADNSGPQVPANVHSIVDQLTEKGIAWRVYQDGLPAAGATDCVSPCARTFNPFVWFDSVVLDPSKVINIVPAAQLLDDLNRPHPPDFIWYVPDFITSGHNSTDEFTDNFLNQFVSQIMSSSWWGNGTNRRIFITWDEGLTNLGIGGNPGGGHIVAIVIDQKGHQEISRPANHYGFLRTLETIYGLPFLGQAADPANGDLLTP